MTRERIVDPVETSLNARRAVLRQSRGTKIAVCEFGECVLTVSRDNNCPVDTRVRTANALFVGHLGTQGTFEQMSAANSGS